MTSAAGGPAPQGRAGQSRARLAAGAGIPAAALPHGRRAPAAAGVHTRSFALLE